ncbi:hypothetical protein LINGRAPRIM_LOCUS657 [Linum grandiflorum]
MSRAGSSRVRARTTKKRTASQLPEYIDAQKRVRQVTIDQATIAAQVNFLTFTPAERGFQQRYNKLHGKAVVPVGVFNWESISTTLLPH